jgi:hypothetical protein
MWVDVSSSTLKLPTMELKADIFKSTTASIVDGRYQGGFSSMYYFPRLPVQRATFLGYSVPVGTIALNGYFPQYDYSMLDSLNYLGKYPVMVMSFENWRYTLMQSKGPLPKSDPLFKPTLYFDKYSFSYYDDMSLMNFEDPTFLTCIRTTSNSPWQNCVIPDEIVFTIVQLTPLLLAGGYDAATFTTNVFQLPTATTQILSAYELTGTLKFQRSTIEFIRDTNTLEMNMTQLYQTEGFSGSLVAYEQLYRKVKIAAILNIIEQFNVS